AAAPSPLPGTVLPGARLVSVRVTTPGGGVRAASGFSAHCQLPSASALQLHWALFLPAFCPDCANTVGVCDSSTPAATIREMLEHKRLFLNCIVAGNP